MSLCSYVAMYACMHACMHLCLYVYTAGVDGESTLLHLLNAKICYSEWNNDSNGGFTNHEMKNKKIFSKSMDIQWHLQDPYTQSEAMISWEVPNVNAHKRKRVIWDILSSHPKWIIPTALQLSNHHHDSNPFPRLQFASLLQKELVGFMVV